MRKIKFQQLGYTLVEALIYIAVFVLMSMIIVSLLLSILESNKHVSPISTISRSAVSVLERVTKEVRNARSVDVANSLFNDGAGYLQLNSTDSVGGQRLVKFYLDSGQIFVSENGSSLGPLTASTVEINSLIFNLATSTTGDLIKIELGLTAGVDTYQKNENFYTAVRLRMGN